MVWDVTTAVSVTACPRADGFGVAPMEVVVPAFTPTPVIEATDWNLPL